MKRILVAILACVSIIVAGVSARQNHKAQHKKEDKFFEVTVNNTQSKKASKIELEYDNSLREIRETIPAGQKRTFSDKGYILDEIEVKQGRRQIEKHGKFHGKYLLTIVSDKSRKGFHIKMIKSSAVEKPKQTGGFFGLFGGASTQNNE